MGRLTAGALAVLAFAAAASPAAAARWIVDPGKSRLGFDVVWSGETFAATFRKWHADIDFDPANLAAAHAKVTIDLDSEDSGSADNDDGLKGAEGFAVDRFPTATFETTGFKATGGSGYVASGRLSLHGATRPLTLPFTLEIAGNRAHMVGKAVVSRIDFGLGTGAEWAGETPIAHQVVITVDLTATKAS